MQRVFLVTGASGGLGSVICETIAKKEPNAAIIMNYLDNENTIIQLSNKLKKDYGSEILLIKADLTKENQLEKIIKIVLEKYKKIDVLINNAGIAIDKKIEDRTYQDLETTFQTNVFAPFILTRAFGKLMFENGKGSIINITSTNGDDTYFPYSIDYDASKAALNLLTKNFAVEYAPNVNVNAIAPGWINTPMNKALPIEYINEETSKILKHRFGEPEEIANVVYFLTTNEASFINGAIINVDGGK